MTMTIVCSGGLGNQLFQYAAARSLCDSRGDPRLIIDTRFYPASSRSTSVGFWLDRYPIRGLIRTYPGSGPFTAHAPARRLWRRAAEGLPGHSYRESDPGFHPEFLGCGPGATAFGYFQSYRYFHDNAAKIRVDLSPNASLSEYYIESLTTAPERIAVHVRRGDYAGNADFDMDDAHGYYSTALTVAKGLNTGLRFRVFSDDIQWCRRCGIFPDDTEYFDPPTPLGPVEDLTVMAASAHFIIANSSYSWWGAYLGFRPGKRVFAPRKWIFGKSADEMAIIPPEWTQV